MHQNSFNSNKMTRNLQKSKNMTTFTKMNIAETLATKDADFLKMCRLFAKKMKKQHQMMQNKQKNKIAKTH